MQSTCASASKVAAARILVSSDWARARSERAISVTGKREKWTVTFGIEAIRLDVSGSRDVFDEGTRMPKRIIGLDILHQDPLEEFEMACNSKWTLSIASSRV